MRKLPVREHLPVLRKSFLLLCLLGPACSADVNATRDSQSSVRAGQAGAASTPSGSSTPAATLPGASSTGTPGNVTTPAGSTTTTRPIGADQCAAISQTATNQLQPADVVWAIDNSGSMREEMEFVRTNMNSFSQQISQSGIDVHIVLLSDVLDADAASTPTPVAGMGGGGPGGGGGRRRNGLCIDMPLGSGSCPEDSKPPSYLHVPRNVGSQNALDIIVMSYPEWKAQMRPNATKSFVVITDDDALQKVDPLGLFGPTMVPTAAERSASFVSMVKALDPTGFAAFKAHAIYSFSMCPQAAAIGTVYSELVKTTGGLAGDLCQQDFKPVFDELARGIVQGSHLACEWVIPAVPAGTSFEVDKVNVQYATVATSAPQTVFHVDAASQCPAQGGWYYDDNAKPGRISVCPATCDAIKNDSSAKVDILFGCATLVPQ